MLCKHEWIGDDECPYCKYEDVEWELVEKDAKIECLKAALETIKTTPGSAAAHRIARMALEKVK